MEVRRYPCEECKATGRCQVCGGSGKRADGSECLECLDGKCMVCMGSGTDRDFYINGRIHKESDIFRWRDWVLIGIVLLGTGAYFGRPEAWSPGREGSALPFLLFGFSLGPTLVAWGLRQRSRDRAVQRAWEREFPSED